MNTSRPRDRKPRVDPARRAAYDVLHEVGSGDAYANVALSQIQRSHELDTRDAAFCTEVVNGTLRYRALLDAVISSCSGRPTSKLDPRVLDVLRMGTYQCLMMRTDSYAAVNTSVELARSVAGEAPVGLVNAVMRKVSGRSREDWTDAVVAKCESADDQLALRYSHPTWVVSSLRDALGAARADELPALLAANNEPARVTLAARPGMTTADALVAGGADPGRWSPYAAIAPSGPVGSFPPVRDRRASVQDEGSQLVACALANATLDGPDASWVDLCAGPGGKLALLAALGAERGAKTVGVELHPHRAELIRTSVGPVPGFAGVVVADSRQPPIRPGVDRVLVDVPCTGLGVVRRRPELRWRRSANDVPALRKLQVELLNSALDLVRSGGVVAYVTCSPHVAETELVVSSVVRKRKDVTVEDSRALFPGVPELGNGPNVRLWPHLHGTDGMFFSLMRRT